MILLEIFLITYKRIRMELRRVSIRVTCREDIDASLVELLGMEPRKVTPNVKRVDSLGNVHETTLRNWSADLKIDVEREWNAELANWCKAISDNPSWTDLQDKIEATDIVMSFNRTKSLTVTVELATALSKAAVGMWIDVYNE